TVSAAYKTADGSATAPSDYASANGTLTFAPGETSKTIDVSVVGDTTVEPDETMTVGLSSPVNAQIADGSATGTIKNEDKPKPRSGHYAGSTSQNRSISFDVLPDVTSITNLRREVGIQCVEVDYSETNIPLGFGSASIRLKPDFSFSVSASDSDSNGKVVLSLGGSLTVGGSASGTLRLDLEVYTSAGTVHCSTGNVTWNAS